MASSVGRVVQQNSDGTPWGFVRTLKTPFTGVNCSNEMFMKTNVFFILKTTATTNLFAADKYISMIINYTAAGCQGAIQLSMLAAYNFNNNVLS